MIDLASHNATDTQLLDIREVAELLRVHPRTLWRLAAQAEAGQSEFPRPLRIGPKTVRWRLADLQAYLGSLVKGRGQ